MRLPSILSRVNDFPREIIIPSKPSSATSRFDPEYDPKPEIVFCTRNQSPVTDPQGAIYVVDGMTGLDVPGWDHFKEAVFQTIKYAPCSAEEFGEVGGLAFVRDGNTILRPAREKKPEQVNQSAKL